MVTEQRSEAPSLVDEPDLASLERLTYVRRFSDGSMDVMFGLGVLLVGITWMLDMVPQGAAIPAILVPLWILLHRKVVIPRTGYAEPTDDRKRTEKASLGMTIVLGVLVFAQLALGILGGSVLDMLPESVVEIFAPGIPAALVAVFAMVGGLITRQKEAYDYALTLAGVGIVGGINELEPGTILAISGGLILLQAGRKFAAFLSSTDRPEED